MQFCKQTFTNISIVHEYIYQIYVSDPYVYLNMCFLISLHIQNSFFELKAYSCQDSKIHASWLGDTLYRW
jgi:hypothetical protein